MSARTFLDEIVARIRLNQGQPTLLLLILPKNADSERRFEQIVGLLQLRGLTTRALPAAAAGQDDGPARWAAATQAGAADVYLHRLDLDGLALRAAARVLNAQRESLRGLSGPLLLLLLEQGERELRQHAPDFFSWSAERYAVPADLQELWAAERPALEGRGLARPEEPAAEPVRFLHLSDLHLRPQRDHDQSRVLRGLLAMLEGRAQPVDLIFLTGDLAQSGTAEEYQVVARFLGDLLAATGVEKRCLFPVPGNHDVDRGAGRWLLRTLTEDAATDFFTQEACRRWHLQKFSAYREALEKLLGKDRPLGLRVGAEAVEFVTIREQRLAVASFNSAWFAQADDDQDRLWLGEACVDLAARRIAQEPEVDLAVALFHHPIDWLAEAERSHIEDHLDRAFDLVLRGHLHKDRVRAELSARGGFLGIAAPAAYQGSRWPNGCFLGEIDVKRRTVRLLPFAFGSGADPWAVDGRVFPDSQDHSHVFDLARKKPRRISLIDRLAPEIKHALFAMDEVERERLLSDLGLRLGSGDRDAALNKVFEDLQRQGRLGELWDRLLAQMDLNDIDLAVTETVIIEGISRELRKEQSEHFDSIALRVLLKRFGQFWRESGSKYIKALRHAKIAPELLFWGYITGTNYVGFARWRLSVNVHGRTLAIFEREPADKVGFLLCRDEFNAPNIDEAIVQLLKKPPGPVQIGIAVFSSSQSSPPELRDVETPLGTVPVLYLPASP